LEILRKKDKITGEIIAWKWLMQKGNK
jgi:hypothetical protein